MKIVSMYNIFPKNKKTNVRKSFCVLLSFVFFCRCLPYKRPGVINQHIWVPFAAVSFVPFRIYTDVTFHRARQRRVPYFWGENPGRIAGNGVSKTCCTPRRGMRTVAPPRFQHSSLIICVPKSCCIRLQTRPSPFHRQRSIYF